MSPLDWILLAAILVVAALGSAVAAIVLLAKNQK